MKVPVETFLASIEEKKLYYFISEKIGTDIPHYFLCIKRTDDDILILACCTSKIETVKRFVESKNLPYKTLVWISPKDESNPFTKDTYVNCNNSYLSTIEDFRAMYESDSVTYSGEISESHYHQILYGIHASPLIDEETKELIPDPDTL